MRNVIRLLFVHLHLLSLVAATRQRQLPTRKGIKWLREERSALVRLDIPELPLWNTEEQIGEDPLSRQPHTCSQWHSHPAPRKRLRPSTSLRVSDLGDINPIRK
jgi:hypothetical protein